MFLKYLKIKNETKIVRDIKFEKGLNLIVDNSKGQITGNGVGKTTVLKLIDYCLGADKRNIWEDTENPKEVYKKVKEFLIDKKILIVLCLTENIDDENAREIIIERNFISSGKEVIRNINGKFYKDEEFEAALKEILLKNTSIEKPTFRQIISHNIRYKDFSISNTLKTLDKYTTDAEYETLYLFLLGCEFMDGNKKQEILNTIKQENKFKKRLEEKQTKSGYEATLALVEIEIEELNKKKSKLNVNQEFQKELDKLNIIKWEINKISSEISKLNIREELIKETMLELKNEKSNIDIQQLRQIYEQATNILGKLHKNFEELVEYHNQMLEEKIKYVSKELPALKKKITEKMEKLEELLKKEEEISKLISKSDSFEELENIINDLNEKYRLKVEYESIIKQLNEVEENLKNYNENLKKIDDLIFNENFEEIIKKQENKFNKYFSEVSNLLYKEQYALKHDKAISRNGRQRIYKFSTFDTATFSSGKKQGEISCFDIAYTLFADEEEISCLHFLLNDKKELMHDNQLVKIGDYVNQKGIQFVASILKDKLPKELKKYFVVELSEDDKLFRIENE